MKERGDKRGGGAPRRSRRARRIKRRGRGDRKERLACRVCIRKRRERWGVKRRD